MPYRIVHPSDDCPSSKPWAVVGGKGDTVQGCHTTEEKAKEQLRALYASVPDAEKLNELKLVRAELDSLRVLRRPRGERWFEALRQRERWVKRFSREFRKLLDGYDDQLDAEKLARMGQREWKKVTKRKEAPSSSAIARAIRTAVNQRSWSSGAESTYIGLAVDAGEDAGQMTLNGLGLNRTFAWAGARDFPENLYAVRGSKVVQHMYGSHSDTLAGKVVAVTDPARPGSIASLAKSIRGEWSKLSRYEASRIARTEAQTVWNATSMNAMQLNGVTTVEGIVAHGPSIGIDSDPVCDYCIEMVGNGPWTMENAPTNPPWHPNCRCTFVPVLPDDWLPPQEPWVGEEVSGLDVEGGLLDREEELL